jgi:hypothetical protein
MKTLIFTLLLIWPLQSIAQLVAPETGAYHAAYADFGPNASDVTAEKIREFETLAKKKLTWAYFANDWFDGKIEFPNKNVEECVKAGVIPYIRLLPWSQPSGNVSKADPVFSMDAILNGDFDEQIKEFALAAKLSNTHIMFEFGPEVNGDWFPWNGKWNGGATQSNYGDPNVPDGPEKFRDAYKKIIDIFRAKGAINTTWILHLDTSWSPRKEWNEAKHYYPGDEYIDWIGLSVFGAQLPNHNWYNFVQKYKNFKSQIDEMTTSKPIMISEFAVIEDKNNVGRKAKWIKQAYSSVEKGLFKEIKAMSYWNSPGWLENERASFKIDTSQSSLETYQDSVVSPFWKTEPLINEKTKEIQNEK